MASKFTKGRIFTDAPEVVAHLLAGGFVYEGDKVQSPAWMLCRQVGDIARMCKYGGLTEAIRKDGEENRLRPWWERKPRAERESKRGDRK